MTLSALVIFFVAEFVFAVTPGPSVAALVTRVISRGWRSVSAVSCSHVDR